LLTRFSSVTPTGFWEALKANWRYETKSLLGFPEWTLFLLTVMILLPVLVLVIIRGSEKEEEGGDNPLALFVSKGSSRAAHALFLGLSVWVALDLPFSPRKIGFGQPLLPYYYLNALVMGYCAGLLLKAGLGEFHGESLLAIGLKLIAKVGAYWACVLVVALPMQLVWRNYPELRWTNGPAVRQFAEQLYDGLPPGKSIALSDSTEQVILLQAALAAHRHEKDALLVDLTTLPLRRYQISLARRFGSRWPVVPATGPEVMGREELLDLVTRLGARDQLVCLNPGFGYYQEPYLDQPKALVHRFWPRAPDDLSSQRLDASAAAANDSYWQAQWTGGVRELVERARLEAAGRLVGSFMGRAFLGREENRTAGGLRNTYARAFDDWGVQLQRCGQWPEAAAWFQRALDLRPNSLAPRINLLYNQRHQRGESGRLDLHSTESEFADSFGNYANWGRVILESGPVDEPTFLNETARALLYEGDSRQAAAGYARCLELAPDWTDCKLWLAQSLVASTNFTRALAITDGIQPERESLDKSKLAQWLYCRVSALQGLGRTNDAVAGISRFVREHSQQSEVLATLAQLFVQERQYKLALTLLDQLLEREPDNPQWLSNKAMVQMELLQPAESLSSLTAALALAPTNQLIRLNRAIVLLKAGDLDAARQEYEVLLQQAPHSVAALFGLEEIAWRQQNRKAAIGLCQQYLAISTAQSVEYTVVSNHLRTLQSPNSGN
jgi:tetratricopeptide (TPR) repeat protein